MRKSFILHLDSLVILEKMTNEQAGNFIKCIYQYQLTNELPKLDFAMEMALTPFVNQFKRDDEKYTEFIESQRQKGIKSSESRNNKKQPLLTVVNRSQPMSTESTYNDNVNDNDNASKNKNKEEVDLYPFEKFWDLYDKKVGEKEKVAKKYNELTQEAKRVIFEYLPKYKIAQPDKKFRKDPTTFLNNKSWNDEIIMQGSQQITGTPQPNGLLYGKFDPIPTVCIGEDSYGYKIFRYTAMNGTVHTMKAYIDAINKWLTSEGVIPEPYLDEKDSIRYKI